jgi:ATP-dependent Lhr-like helicase
MRRALPEALASELGRLDPAAIDQVSRDAWPDVRDADELHDALLTLIALPEAAEAGSSPGAALRARVAEAVPQWEMHFDELTRQNRATRAEKDGRRYWVCAERAAIFKQIFGSASFADSLPDIGGAASSQPWQPSKEDALLAMITGWISHSGPTTAAELAGLLGIPPEQVDKALLRLEAGGSILRGQFTNTPGQQMEWCERRLLARIHRLTVGELRKQVQPVTPAQFMRWLLRWQHVAPGTQLTGERGVLEILRQLQGFEAPANSWERQIFKQRVADYAPQVLDHLCLTGAVGWGRLSPHPATLETVTSGGRRVIPTRVAPIAFFVRDDADWMAARRGDNNDDGQQALGLSAAAREVHAFLRERGASFFPDIVRGTRRLKAEVETGLWELVTAGLITADGFDNLRALIDPKRRAGQGSGRTARPRHSSGRWSLLYTGAATDRATDRADDRDRALEAICGVLLRRYGVVFREVLVRESILPPWRELLGMLRRLEGRGEVRGGRFVTDFLGEQFALPIAVESLRATRRESAVGETVIVSAADPLNLAGIVVPGDRVAANSGAFVAFHDGAAADLAAPTTAMSAAL